MKTTCEQIEVREFMKNNPLDTIGIIAGGNYEHVILLDRGQVSPMSAIEYLATATRMCDKFACSELEEGVLYIY